MQQYTYDGPVVEFDRLVSDGWRGSTYAVSPGKARSNLEYQYKKQNNRALCTKISLPGKIMKVG